MSIKEDPYKFLNRICENIKAIEEEDEEEEEVGFFESEEWEHIVYDDPNRTPLY
jgi:hypothetical protein